MVGEVEESGRFPKQFRPAMIPTTLLEERSHDVNCAILSSTKSSGDVDCDKFVYAETMKEISKGWLEGPFRFSELEKGSSISRRFGLWQKTKYRCIDDFSGSLVNATCSVNESPFIHTIDISCALLDRWMRSCQNFGQRSPLSSFTSCQTTGSILRFLFSIHPPMALIFFEVLRCLSDAVNLYTTV